ncbi:MAG: type II secretion system protein GspM [Gammaproteobacteria bacterium]
MIKRYQQQWQQLADRLNETAAPLRKQIIQNPYWQQTQQRWQQLSKREHYLVKATAWIFLIVFLYQFIWIPLTDAITRYNQDVILDQETLTYMQAAAPRLLAAKGQVKPNTTLTADMFLPTVENTLKENGMMPVVSELSLNNENQVSVVFNTVEFDGLMQWLVALQQQYGIKVQEFNAVPTDTPGFAQVSMQLSL